MMLNPKKKKDNERNVGLLRYFKKKKTDAKPVILKQYKHSYPEVPPCIEVLHQGKKHILGNCMVFNLSCPWQSVHPRRWKET